MNKKVNNALYKTTVSIGAGKFKQIAWYLVNIVFFKNALNISSDTKVLLLKLFGAGIGQGVLIKPSVNIKYPWKLAIGNYSWVGENVWIDNLSDVTIGENVTLSQGALLLSGSHDYSKETFDFLSAKIILEDGVWIGARAIVLGGVCCGTHAVLSAASVTSRDLESYMIYQGIPAKPVKARVIA